MRPASRRAGLLVMVIVIASRGTSAQERVTLQADALFYGDNTEFRNPFREGETIFGATLRGCAVVAMNDRVELSFGVVGNHLFGDDDGFELVRPVIAVTFKGRRSAFVFGTLPLSRRDPGAGPDHDGPHGLLPPLQRETLAFTRPYEAGFQWTFTGDSVEHAAWLNWQRVNTAAHRERFDAGFAGQLRAASWLSMPIQLHIVHEGGQLFASGVVRDSAAAALGLQAAGAAAAFERASIEIFALASRYVPDREEPARSRTGAGFLGRASVERSGWRGHVLFWRGKDFITDEGDPNYLSIRRDGSYYRGTRDYAEAGVTRAFRPAQGVAIAVSARIHRIEADYEYSYRVIATANLGLRLR
jgi:hypothetical protein